jgi:hypothetical protein
VRIRKPDTRNRQFLEGGGIKEERAMKIEGVPDGWELVRIGRPLCGEQVLSPDGRVVFMIGGALDVDYVILRKVEKPKTYRPFANAEEFKPHRNKWWKWNPVKFVSANGTYPPSRYDDNGHGAETWQQNLSDKVFDDGTPFGVEVSDGP